MEANSQTLSKRINQAENISSDTETENEANENAKVLGYIIVNQDWWLSFQIWWVY